MRMPSVTLHRRFVQDLLSTDDKGFVNRILKHIFDETNGDANKKNDHRYDGVDGAWIRYASSGRTAYRIIYLRRDDQLIFWRCGYHSVEDRLSRPTLGPDELIDINVSDEEVIEVTKPLTVLATHRPPHIYSAVLGRRLIPNKSVFLVSPFIEPSVLARGSRIGQAIDSMVIDGAEIIVISAAERVRDHDKLHRDLQARGIELVYLPKLHSKIYLFITDSDRGHVSARTPSLGIVGSSNLTLSGVPSSPGDGNLEVNYTVDPGSIEVLESIVTEYYVRSRDYPATLKSVTGSKASIF